MLKNYPKNKKNQKLRNSYKETSSTKIRKQIMNKIEEKSMNTMISNKKLKCLH